MLTFAHDARPSLTAFDHAWAAFALGIALGAVGDRGMHAIRAVLSVALVALGAWFVWQGIRG